MKMNICAGCQRNIQDRFLLNVNEHTWHAQCLRCTACGQQLTDKCMYRNGNIYCKKDFFKLFGTKCSGCSVGILPTDYVRRTKNLVYHTRCFVCLVCRKELDTGDQCYELDDCKLVCKEDFVSVRHSHPVVGSPSEAEIDESLFSPCESDHIASEHIEDDNLLSNSNLHHNQHLTSNHQLHSHLHLPAHLHQQTPPSHLNNSPLTHGHFLSNSVNNSNPLNSLSQLSINSANNSLNNSSSNNTGLCPPLHLSLTNNQPVQTNTTNINSNGANNNGSNSLLNNGQLNGGSSTPTPVYNSTGLMTQLSNNGSNNPGNLLINGTQSNLINSGPGMHLIGGGPAGQTTLSQLTINCSQTQLPLSLIEKSSPISANSDDLSELNGSNELLNGESPSSNPGKRRGPRTTIKARQLETLKAAFNDHPKPTRHHRETLAQQTGLNMRVIQVWFQNRRSKERRMNQNKSMTQRRIFFRNNRNNSRSHMRTIKHQIGDDEQSLSAQGSNFCYFSESSNPSEYYANQGQGNVATPNPNYYNDYGFNPQQNIITDGSLSRTPILTSLNGSTSDSNLQQQPGTPQSGTGTPQLQTTGQQNLNGNKPNLQSNNQIINTLPIQTSPQSNSCSSSGSLNGPILQSSMNQSNNSQLTTTQTSTASNQIFNGTSSNEQKPLVTASDFRV